MEKEIIHIDYNELKDLNISNGLVFQGFMCKANELSDAVNAVLTENHILLEQTRFKRVYVFEKDGFIHMLFPFDNDIKIAYARLAMWRMVTKHQYGGTWFSDYINMPDGNKRQDGKPERFMPKRMML